MTYVSSVYSIPPYLPPICIFMPYFTFIRMIVAGFVIIFLQRNRDPYNGAMPGIYNSQFSGAKKLQAFSHILDADTPVF